MSSISTLHRSVESLDWSRPYPKVPSFDLTTYGSKRGKSGNTYLATGLPTPPGSKAMPAVVLGNSYPDFSDQEFRRDGEHLYDRPNTSRQHKGSSAGTSSNTYNLVPSSNDGLGLYSNRTHDQDKVDVIAPHLQIPDSVNKSKGSLAEFTAEITCLFWFETASTLQHAENLPVDAPVDRGLLPDATPTIGFRKWVTTIISTTQVGRNVIMLALMFIYRLKRFNPTVSGKRGSEFRLLTIALMLGNKFLDDNTYTNKTWAEVSGISVNEIHIMEVEFLSNMRYALYASAEEWTEWKAKLGRFGAFYDKASQLAPMDESIGAAPVTPTSQTFSHRLPSPSSTHRSASPFTSSLSLSSHYPKLPHPLSTVPQITNSPLRQPQPPAASHHGRKRSPDASADMPPAKRLHHPSGLVGQGPNILNPLPYPSNSHRVSHGDLNHITDSTPAAAWLDIVRSDVPTGSTSMARPLGQLAPLTVPVSRAMSSVYPNASAVYSQPATPVSAMSQNLFPNPISSLGDPSRPIATSPYAHTSPSSAGFNTTHPISTGLSPSYFLTHRSSPYRPVRHVNTLLIPPPSAALQVPVRSIPSDQMHYQPLSKTATERYSGPVPFMQLDPWQHSNVSTPTGQQPHPF